ncbi:MAG: OsmC family protein [Anaerolineaceae bacterium]|nr:OsmC family protein [Anaerolineaceae bacterium]
MIKRKSNAVWQGNLKDGKGLVSLGSGTFSGRYSFLSRFEKGVGTNPEELIAAAHAGCFSMALSADLSKAGYTVKKIETEAIVSMDKTDSGFAISGIKLVTKASVKDIDLDTFLKFANGAKQNCPVSKALAAVPVELEAQLVK